MFAEQGLDDTVAADADLQLAAVAPAVVGTTVGVVALFGRFEDAVPTERGSRDETFGTDGDDSRCKRRRKPLLERTCGAAAVTRDGIAIVALFGILAVTIATRKQFFRLVLTGRIATVTVDLVAVIALFAIIEPEVAAHGPGRGTR